MPQGTHHEPRPSLAVRGFGNAYLLLTLAMLFWAGNAVTGRGVSELVPPMALAWMRWTFATLLILPLAWPHLRRDRAVILARWPTLLGLGALGCGAFNTLYYVGLGRTPAVNALILNSVVPMLVPLACYAIYRVRLRPALAVGVALSFIGVLTVLTKGDSGLLATLSLNEGDLWVLAAVVSWTMYTALLREQPPMHWMSFAAVTFAVAAVVNFPLFLTEHLFFRQIQVTPGSVLAIAYVSTMPSIAAYIAYTRGVQLIGPNRAGAFVHLIPLFGAVLAVVFLGESLHLYHAFGFALILAGVWLAARQAKATRPL